MRQDTQSVRIDDEIDEQMQKGGIECRGDDSFQQIADLAMRLLGCDLAIVDVVGVAKITGGVGFARSGNMTTEATRSTWRAMRDGPWSVDIRAVDSHRLTDGATVGALGLHFFVSIPLRNSNSTLYGALAVLDRQPRGVSQDEIDSLKRLAALAVRLIDLSPAIGIHGR